MAKADQIKALLKSHMEGDDQRFYSVAMQVAAGEAKAGHGVLAEELRALIDLAKKRRGEGKPVPISRPKGQLAGLLTVSYPKTRFSDMVLNSPLELQLKRVVREQRHAAKILSHGLSPRRKLLLVGPPGTGKTLTASLLAGALGIPLFQVRLDGLLTKFMGETAAKLRQIFDATEQTRGVYFFDEFDAIGTQRGLPNDVGEIRRVLNSFLQMIEQDQSHSLILAATNHMDALDYALFRRFDDVLRYTLPNPEQVVTLLKSRLALYDASRLPLESITEAAQGLSYAEIARAAEDVAKEALIDNRKSITEQDVRRMLLERQVVCGGTQNTKG